MSKLSIIETAIIGSRIFIKIFGFALIWLLNLPSNWISFYFLAIIVTEVLETASFYYAKKFPKLKKSYYIILSFINSFLFLYFIYKTNLIFTDFYIVGFLVVLASTIQGGPLPGFISSLTTATFYSLFLNAQDARRVYYLRSFTFFALWILVTIVLRIALTAIKEKKEAVIRYETEIERLKDEFVAVASHNLLTPLTTLKGYLSILTSNRRIPTKEKTFYIERATTSAIRLEEIVNELISVALLERTDKVLFLKYTDLEEILDYVYEDFRLIAEQKEIGLDVSMPDKKLPKILVDSRRIRQAVSNLLSNALKYTNQGGQVNVNLRQDGKSAFISISDNGMGIPKEKMTKLFSKFYKAHTYTEGYSSEGTGLGLYITKLIVDSHGGKIKVESDEGKGSNFTIQLPIKK